MRYTSKQAAREQYIAKFGIEPLKSWTEEKIRYAMAAGTAKPARMTAKRVLAQKYIAVMHCEPAKTWTAAVMAEKLSSQILPRTAAGRAVGGMTVAKLKEWATSVGLKGRSKMLKAELLSHYEEASNRAAA